MKTKREQLPKKEESSRASKRGQKRLTRTENSVKKQKSPRKTKWDTGKTTYRNRMD